MVGRIAETKMAAARPQLQLYEWPLEGTHDTFNVHVHVEKRWHKHILSDWSLHEFRGNCLDGHEVHIEIKCKRNV